MRPLILVLTLLFGAASSIYSNKFSEYLKETCGKHAYEKQLQRTSRALILNGRLARRNEFPSQVSLLIVSVNDEGTKLSHQCGGTLISPTHVITAAHCFVKGKAAYLSDIYVGFGTICSPSCDSDDSPKYRKIKKLVIPKLYERISHKFDIAIAVLEKAASMDYACLPPMDHPSSQQLTVVGWGSTANGGGDYPTDDSPTLRVANVDWMRDGDSVIETFPGPSDSCEGDSGGGLYENKADGRRMLVGVVSTGPEGCKETFGIWEDSPPSYTRVAYFSDWICYWTGVCSDSREDVSIENIPESLFQTMDYNYQFPADSFDIAP